MTAFLVDAAQVALDTLGRNFLQVLTYPVDPDEKLFVLYLATSFLLAGAAYVWMWRRSLANGSRLRLREYLFPSHVWSTRSAWLDVRYFFFHQVFRVTLYGALLVAVSNATFSGVSRLFGDTVTAPSAAPVETSWFLELGYALISIALLDFVAYLLHYCQHHVPLLWEFHRVHHSATVMHPLTNYREHPVDNVFYALGLGACAGLVTALVSALLGYVPAQPTVAGVGVFAFAFNVLGYHLRHSHIWLRWPGWLVYLFGCPAHHQVHHSFHPSHINRNFAFMFPVWDLIFGTFHVPRSNVDVKFGLDERQQEEFTSCLDLYWLPFRNVIRSYLLLRFERESRTAVDDARA